MAEMIEFSILAAVMIIFLSWAFFQLGKIKRDAEILKYLNSLVSRKIQEHKESGDVYFGHKHMEYFKAIEDIRSFFISGETK